MVNRGFHLARESGQATTIVVTHRGLSACLADGQLRLPFARPAAARLLSEQAFERRLAADASPPSPVGSPYTGDEVARLSGLPVGTCEALAVFDVIGEGEGRFAYRDLAVARQVRALVGRGVAVTAVIRAAWTLAAQGLGLPQVRLQEAPWGEMMQQVGGGLARLDGQFALVLDDAAGPPPDDSLAQAVAAEAAGALAEAERWYRRAAQADRRDPVPAFNLGNLLAGLGRDAEAMIALQQALARDPVFAEASFNLAGLYEKTGQEARALSLYGETVEAHPAYAQALYNLARLLTRRRDFATALPLWDRFIALVPDDADARHARRAALLCRMELR